METFGRMARWSVAILGTLGIVALGLTTVAKVRAMQADEISPGKNGPSVNLVSAPLPSIPRGEPGNVDLRFHIASGYHVNTDRTWPSILLPTKSSACIAEPLRLGSRCGHCTQCRPESTLCEGR